jgi:hypothetical protein
MEGNYFMKLVGAISTAVLSFTLGVGIPAYAQQEQHDQQEENKSKPAGEKEKKAQPGKQEEKNAHQQDKNNKQEEKSAQQQDRNNKQVEKNTQQHHAQPVEHARNNGGGRIPDDRYRANFGQGHRFRVSQGDYSNRRFQYGGYSFGFVDAWPSNWLYTQDVFVIEIDGVYYLCNASYPGVNITLNVIL